MDFLRTAHGTGAPALEHAETPPVDELSPLNAGDTADGLASSARRGRPFQRGNSAAKGRKPGLALMGLPIDSADPRYRRALRKAKSYMLRRSRELAAQHGGYIGAGPCAILTSGAMALAASRLLYQLGGETLDKDLFTTAARLGAEARQCEITAAALAQRESEGRPRTDPIVALSARLDAIALESPAK